MIKEECFAKTITGGCSALNVDECDYDKCSFYKSKEDAILGYRRAEKRCKRLGIPSWQDYIIWKKAKDMAEQYSDSQRFL